MNRQVYCAHTNTHCALTHLSDFLYFILCLRVVLLELENHLVIYRGYFYCHLRALKLKYTVLLVRLLPSNAGSYFFSANRAAPLRAYALKYLLSRAIARLQSDSATAYLHKHKMEKIMKKIKLKKKLHKHSNCVISFLVLRLTF